MGRNYIPLAIYGVLAVMYLLGSKRGASLKCVLASSYCGVVLISFTAGTTASMWLVTIFLFLLFWKAISKQSLPSFNSRLLTGLTYAILVIYLYGVLVGLLRYDPSLEIVKAGVLRSLFGIPLRILMAGYRVAIIISLFLAFSLPLRYHMDEKLLLQCLKICWIFTVILSVAMIVDYAGIFDLKFSIETVAWAAQRYKEEQRGSILGFHRAATGMFLLVGIFMSFAMTQITRSYTLKITAYWTAPILIIALLFSWSRAATLGIAFGAISLALTLRGIRALKGIIVTICGAVLVFSLLSRFPELNERISFWLTGKSSLVYISAGRIHGWIGLMSWLVRRPDVLLTGCGFQNFNYYITLRSEDVFLVAAHNSFLHILTEEGFIGLIVFLLWAISILFWLISWRQLEIDPKKKAIPGIMLSLMLGIFVTSLTQESLVPTPTMVPFITYFYLILGLWVSYYRSEMTELYYGLDTIEDESYESEGEVLYQMYEHT